MKSTYAQTIDETELDPRVVRTRHLLLHAFEELLSECGIIRNVSIQAITERAGVNRVTFYAHFTDKYELLEFWKRELFRRKLTYQQLNTTALTWQQLINAVLDFMQEFRSKRRPVNQQFDPLFEAAIQNEIQATLLYMPEVDEDVAVFLAWAIFGSANAWSRTEQRLPQEAMSTQLLHLVNKILY
jgi:AcrR family transcriptional regulator